MRRRIDKPLVLGIAVAAVLTILVSAFDGRLHWDEPSFLFKGAYLELQEILEGSFQGNETPFFTYSRILHILTVHAVASVTGLGWPLLISLAGLYGLLWIGGLALVWRLLREMGVPRLAGTGVLIAAAAPVSVYMLGKTMPEAPAFAFAVLCCYGLWKVSSPKASGRAIVLWVLLIAVAHPVILLTKNVMVLMVGAFGFAVLLIPATRSRRRLLIYGAAGAVGGILLFLGTLSLFGMRLQEYLGLISAVTAEAEPVASLMLHVGLEAGVLFALVPLGLLSKHRKLCLVFLLWFAASTVPIVLRLSSVEARYLIPNLPALAGLFALSLEWMSQRLRIGHTVTAAMASGAVAILVLLPNAWLPQLIMAHEVEVGAMDAMVSRMRQEAPAEGPAVLCPFDYTTFFYLRVVYPELDAYSVSTLEPGVGVDANTFARGLRVRRQVLGPRMIENRQQLARLMGRTAFYFGFAESFPVANLRRLVSYLPAGLNRRLDELLSQLGLLAHLETSWLWESVRPQLAEPMTNGHYRAYRIEIGQLTAPSGSR